MEYIVLTFSWAVPEDMVQECRLAMYRAAKSSAEMLLVPETAAMVAPTDPVCEAEDPVVSHVVTARDRSVAARHAAVLLDENESEREPMDISAGDGWAHKEHKEHQCGGPGRKPLPNRATLVAKRASCGNKKPEKKANNNNNNNNNNNAGNANKNKRPAEKNDNGRGKSAGKTRRKQGRQDKKAASPMTVDGPRPSIRRATTGSGS